MGRVVPKPFDTQTSLEYQSQNGCLIYTSHTGAKKIIQLPNIESVTRRLDNCKNCGAGRTAIKCDYFGTRT